MQRSSSPGKYIISTTQISASKQAPFSRCLFPDYQKLDAFRNRLRTNMNVSDVTFGSNAPVGVDGSYGTSYRLPQQAENESHESLMIVTDVDLHSVLRS
ncbi:MAG: hypothetical protein WDO15_07180 [Bacteroidota bacterium]